MKITLLFLIILSLFSCKQKTELLKKKEENKEVILNYSPFVERDTPIFAMQIDGPIINKVEYIINQDNVEGKHFLGIYTEDEGLEDIEEEYPSIQDLLKDPEDFRTPVLGDFCSNDKGIEYVAHKYSLEDGSGRVVYAFGLAGKCDGEEVRCAALYFTYDQENLQRIIPEGEIFHYPYFDLILMGLDGKHQGCQKIKEKAFPIYGCMDPSANNYDSEATRSFICTYDPPPPPAPIYGCTDDLANNYDEFATVDDGTCTYDPPPIPQGIVFNSNLINPSMALSNSGKTLSLGAVSGGTGYHGYSQGVDISSGGKYYVELSADEVVDDELVMGFVLTNHESNLVTFQNSGYPFRADLSDIQSYYQRVDTDLAHFHYGTSGTRSNNTTDIFSEGNTLMMALDFDNDKVKIGVNGVWFHNVADNTSGIDMINRSPSLNLMYLGVHMYPKGGQTSVSITSQYSAPTGYFAL